MIVKYQKILTNHLYSFKTSIKTLKNLLQYILLIFRPLSRKTDGHKKNNKDFTFHIKNELYKTQLHLKPLF